MFLRHGRSLVLTVPWFWLLLFFAVPFFILLRISVTDMGEGLNPFAPLVTSDNGQVSLHLKLSNYVSLLHDADSGWLQTLYTESYLLSLKYALWTTLLCLFFGYPFAYFLARSQPSVRPLLLLMVMLLLQLIVMASPLLNLKQKNSRAQKVKLNAGSSITMRSKNLCYRISLGHVKLCKSH
jgi:ABC-type spermidine/putrescine transport system permease subunit I